VRGVGAGERALSGRAGPAPAGPLDAAAAAWTDGMLVANRMRLDRFRAELGRYRQGLGQCESELAGKLVTGAFRLDDTDEALALLARVLGVRVRYRTRYWVTVVPA
ncbi:iron dicitrate transport regulator FecR, partial [Achromobacter ruhlandii]|nr:iron dicitrate transport regulator FecR [Achromobacter ruhlandii]